MYHEVRGILATQPPPPDFWYWDSWHWQEPGLGSKQGFLQLWSECVADKFLQREGAYLGPLPHSLEPSVIF